MNDPGSFVFGLIVGLVVMLGILTSISTPETVWHQEAVDHGAAHYDRRVAVERRRGGGMKKFFRFVETVMDYASVGFFTVVLVPIAPALVVLAGIGVVVCKVFKFKP